MSDVGMHTLTSGICIDESCTVYDMNMRPSRGKCLVSDSGSSVRAAVLNPQVSMERGSSVVECRTRNQVSPGSNPPLLPFRRLGIFVLSIDAPVHSAV